MDPIFSWNELFKLGLTLIVIYSLLRITAKVLVLISKKIRTKRWIRGVFDKIMVFYFPIGVSLLLTVFAGINFLAHGLLILIIGILAFNHIRAYINGVLFRSNPLITIGKNFVFNDYLGQIERFLPLGVIINGTNGKRFINYSEIQKVGFSVAKMHDDSHRHELYLKIEDDNIDILDLLFQNPLVNLNHKPLLKKTANRNDYCLQFTLEKGATVDQIVAFLNQYQINEIPHN